MAPSDRFKPIQKIALHKERKAAAALGESLKTREAAVQRLDELRHTAEYQERFARPWRATACRAARSLNTRCSSAFGNGHRAAEGKCCADAEEL